MSRRLAALFVGLCALAHVASARAQATDPSAPPDDPAAPPSAEAPPSPTGEAMPGPDPAYQAVAVPSAEAIAASVMAEERAIVREELGNLLELERKHRFGSAISSFVMGAGMIGLGTYFLVDDTQFSDRSQTMNRYVGASFIVAGLVPIATGAWRLATPAPYEVGIERMLADPSLSTESGLAMLELAAERDRQLRLMRSLGSLVFGGIGLGVGSLFVSEQDLSDRTGWIVVSFAGLSVLKGTWGLLCQSAGEKIYSRARGRIASGGLSDVEVTPTFGVAPNGGAHGGLGVSGRF